MNKFLKFGLIGVLVALVVIQFVGPAQPEVSHDNPQDLFAVSQIDGEVEAMLRSACYDCHSMETTYPWYAGVAPVKWSIYHHVEEGREELNFSAWGEMEIRRKIRKLKEIAEEVAESKMPLEGYVKLHPEADLTEEQKEKLIAWAEGLAEEILE